MEIFTALKIGAFHTNFCEDFLVYELLSTDQYLVAVMDGCTMGTESVFASILYGKTLRKIAKDLYYLDFVHQSEIPPSAKLKQVLENLFQQLRSIKNQLGLETAELLSTLIIGIIDQKHGSAQFLTVGDGLICHDGKLIEYEQDNTPDYLGYHLKEDFNHWFAAQQQLLEVSSFKDLSICTDGIFTFQPSSRAMRQKPMAAILHFLLEDTAGSGQENFMERKIRQLETEDYHVPGDDVAIIRLRHEV